MKAKLEPFASTGDDHRNSLVVRHVKDRGVGSHAAMLRPLINRVQQEVLVDLIEQAREEDLEVIPKSESYFDDFHRAAPIHNPTLLGATPLGRTLANEISSWFHQKSEKGFHRKNYQRNQRLNRRVADSKPKTADNRICDARRLL